MRIDIPPDMRDVWLEIERGRSIADKAVALSGGEAERLGGLDFQRLLESIYDAALITDINGQVLDANPRAEEFLELSRAALCRVNVTSMISGADAETMRELNKGLCDERFILIQAYCARANGKLFPAEIAVNQMLVQNRACLCFFIRDITVRRQDEERLRAEHNAIQNAGTGIAIADMNGRITFANTAAARVFGVADHEALEGRPLKDLFTEARLIGEMFQTAEAGRTWEGEMHALCGADGEVWVRVAASANRDVDNELIGFVVSVMNISDHKRAEEAERMAERQRVMVESLGAACHHLGQPATVLMMSLDAMSRVADKDPDLIRELIDAGLEAAESLRHMLHELNDMTEYRTVPYIIDRDGEVSKNQRILDVK
ncbi:MAG: PAS domain S-box protein [bacterium]